MENIKKKRGTDGKDVLAMLLPGWVILSMLVLVGLLSYELTSYTKSFCSDDATKHLCGSALAVDGTKKTVESPSVDPLKASLKAAAEEAVKKAREALPTTTKKGDGSSQ